MPLTLAVPHLLALFLHMRSQIGQTETGIPPVPLGCRHILQKGERHMPMSATFLLPWAVTPVTALLVAQLLLAAEAENVPHHAVGYLNHMGARLKTIISVPKAGPLEPNGHSAYSL